MVAWAMVGLEKYWIIGEQYYIYVRFLIGIVLHSKVRAIIRQMILVEKERDQVLLYWLPTQSEAVQKAIRIVDRVGQGPRSTRIAQVVLSFQDKMVQDQWDHPGLKKERSIIMAHIRDEMSEEEFRSNQADILNGLNQAYLPHMNASNWSKYCRSLYWFNNPKLILNILKIWFMIWVNGLALAFPLKDDIVNVWSAEGATKCSDPGFARSFYVFYLFWQFVFACLAGGLWGFTILQDLILITSFGSAYGHSYQSISDTQYLLEEYVLHHGHGKGHSEEHGSEGHSEKHGTGSDSGSDEAIGAEDELDELLSGSSSSKEEIAADHEVVVEHTMSRKGYSDSHSEALLLQRIKHLQAANKKLRQENARFKYHKKARRRSVRTKSGARNDKNMSDTAKVMTRVVGGLGSALKDGITNAGGVLKSVRRASYRSAGRKMRKTVRKTYAI
jgi:hypothetical protein